MNHFKINFINIEIEIAEMVLFIIQIVYEIDISALASAHSPACPPFTTSSEH